VTRTGGARGRSGGVAAATWISGAGEGPVEKVPLPHGGEGGTADNQDFLHFLYFAYSSRLLSNWFLVLSVHWMQLGQVS